MAIRELKDQIARLPEQPGVYLYFNAAGDTIYVGKARALRDRVRNYLGAYGTSPKTDALLDDIVAPRVHRHRFGGRGAGAREQPDQAAQPQIQHPAARRQELPVPPAHHHRGISPRARRAERRARRQLLRRAVHARALRSQDDGVDASAVRDPVLQRGDHRPAQPPVPRTRHQALHRPVRRVDLRPAGIRARRRAHATVPRGAERGTDDGSARPDARGLRRRALRGSRTASRRHPHHPDAGRPPAEDGHRGPEQPRRVRHESGPGGRCAPGLPGPRRTGRRTRGTRHRGGRRRA